MAVTQGFTFSYSDTIVVNVPFPYLSTYIYVQGAGDLVYEAPDGTPQWIQAAQPGYHQISALRMLSSGTISDIVRTTTVTGAMYCCAPTY